MFEDFEELGDLFKGKSDARKKELIDFINNLHNLRTRIDDGEDSLGEPTKVTKFEENGYTFEESVWETKHGSIVKIETIGTPYELNSKGDKSPLDEIPLEVQLKMFENQLKMAVDEERYEDASEIRDTINKMNIDLNKKK